MIKFVRVHYELFSRLYGKVKIRLSFCNASKRFRINVFGIHGSSLTQCKMIWGGNVLLFVARKGVTGGIDYVCVVHNMQEGYWKVLVLVCVNRCLIGLLLGGEVLHLASFACLFTVNGAAAAVGGEHWGSVDQDQCVSLMENMVHRLWRTAMTVNGEHWVHR